MEECLVQKQEQIVGVDVAKDSLACATAGHGRQVLANTQGAIRSWLSGLPAGSVVAMESTGRYHQLLANLAHQAGMQVYVLNAKDVYFYAKALGMRGKTDRTDAEVIARYVAEHQQRLHPWLPGTTAQQQLQELVRRRSGITTHRAALRQVLAGVDSIATEVRALEVQFEQLLASVDRQIAQSLEADQDMKQAHSALQTITGIKLVGSALLISLLSKVPFANADALVAYSGLDPRPNDSGNKRGIRVLSKKGPPELRRQMYLAAFSATRSKAFKPLYASLLARGFKPTQAMVIIARKLLRIAWAVWKSRKPFDPSRFAAANS
jgi:transposase